MKPLRMMFPLTSEQLELLFAFEQNSSLAKLAEHMGKDQSVISRQLQKLAEDSPVIQKINGKWNITSLGSKLNEITSRVVAEYERNLAGEIKNSFNFGKSALVVINAQKALLESKAPRSNLVAEKNILSLLSYWRRREGKIFHVQHISENPDSAFFKTSTSAQFMNDISPLEGEIVVQKNHSSSFSGTRLQDLLESQSITTLVLVGFTANDCIEATARDSFEIGFNTFVVEDGTAMFDFVAHDNRLYKADKIHDLVMANIGLRFGRVESAKFFLELKN